MGSRPVTALRVESGLAQPRGMLARIGETFALIVLFGFTLEAACRVEDWVEFRTPILARERSQEDLLIRDQVGVHGRPDGHFQKWSLNALGMRGPAATFAKPTRVLRVVTAGASETFGLYESPGREYPRQLEDSLNARLQAAGSACGGWRAQVLNAAMPGMSLPTIEQDIRLRETALKPDVVVIYATPSMYLDDVAPVAAHRDTASRGVPELPWRYAILPRVADRIRVQLKSLLPAVIQDRIRRKQIDDMIAEHPKGWRFKTVPIDRLHQFEADLRQTLGSVRASGATPVLMTHANRFAGSTSPDVPTLRAWEKFYPRAEGRTIVAFDSVARLATIRVARDSGTVVVDLATSLAQTHGKAFADYAHFTDAGAALTAGSTGAAIFALSATRICPALEGNERVATK